MYPTNYKLFPFFGEIHVEHFLKQKVITKTNKSSQGPTTQHVEDEACLSKCENAFPWEWPLTLLSGWTLWGCPYPALVRWHPARWHHHILVIVRPPCLPLRAGPPCQGYDTLPPDDHCTTPHYMELHIKSQNTPFFSDLWNIWKGGWGVMAVGVAKILKYCKVCKFLLQKYRVFFTLGLPLKVLRTQKII